MRILIAVAIWVARVIYAVLGLLPRRHKVVMLSRQADLPSKDFILLAEEFRRRDPSLEVVVRCRFIRSGTIAHTAYLVEVLVQMYHLATARVCVLDSYNVPLSVLNHGSDLFVIQLWHALGAIKQFGYQSIGQPGGRSPDIARAMRMHRNYDVVLCGGPGSIDTFAAAFDVDPRIVLPLGLPRVDYLRAACETQDSSRPSAPIAKLQERFPRLAEPSKIVVLYAPTFRWHGGSAFRDVVEAFAADDFTLVIKPHDFEAAAVAGEHVVDATGVSVLDLLPICDVVVTDYSAVAFEAAAIEKPVYYYVYDLDEYRSAHGLNINPLDVLPAVSSECIQDLVALIAEQDYDPEVGKAFRESFVPPRGSSSTSRIADLVFSHTDSGG